MEGYSEAIRLDPMRARAFSNRALSLAAQGKSDQAIADLTEAIRLDPKYAKAFYGRGMSWRK